MNEQPAAQSSPGAADGPRSSLTGARLTLAAALGVFVFAGAGLAALFMLALAVEFNWLDGGGDGDWGVLAPSVLVFLLGLFQLGHNHRRGTPFLECAASAFTGVVILFDVLLNGILLTLYLGSDTRHGMGSVFIWDTFATVLSLTFFAAAGIGILLLHMRERRLRRLSAAQAAAPHWWRTIAWWAALAAALATAVGGTLYFAREIADQQLLAENVLLDSIFFSHFFWNAAAWLIPPLTLMASDSYLLLRQRRGQEGQAAAP